MMGFLLRTVVTMLGLWLASAVVPGVTLDTTTDLVLAALLMGLVNAFVRPLFVLLTLPFTVITLGLFLLVVNAGMFALTAALLDGFHVSGFWSALGGWLIVSLTSTLVSWGSGPDDETAVVPRS